MGQAVGQGGHLSKLKINLCIASSSFDNENFEKNRMYIVDRIGRMAGEPVQGVQGVHGVQGEPVQGRGERQWIRHWPSIATVAVRPFDWDHQ